MKAEVSDWKFQVIFMCSEIHWLFFINITYNQPRWTFAFWLLELNKKCQELEKQGSSSGEGDKSVEELEKQVAEMVEEKEQLLVAYNAVQTQQQESLDVHKVWYIN